MKLKKMKRLSCIGWVFIVRQSVVRSDSDDNFLGQSCPFWEMGSFGTSFYRVVSSEDKDEEEAG